MKPYAERKAETERLVALLPEVHEQLSRVPGVTQVSVGLRERGGRITEEIVFRVHVGEKIPRSAVPAGELLPSSSHGVPIDVIVERLPQPEIGLNDESDDKPSRPVVGGIYVRAKNVPGKGTLGCFCRRTTDNKLVFLSNYHVLVGKKGAVGNAVGQPDLSGSNCCTCGQIGTVVDADKPLDCAIADLQGDINHAPKVRRILRDDGTVEQEGTIVGSGVPIPGDEVYKVGARTGLTRGMVTGVAATQTEVSPVAPFTRMSDEGDSGSVYISSFTGDVVALHWGGDGKLGFAVPFDAVKARLRIEVIPTPPDTAFAVVDATGEVEARSADPPFKALIDELQQSPAGLELLHLLREHRREVLELVNERRRFTLTWQRCEGPAFLAALTRSARDQTYRIPRSIHGIARGDATRQVSAALRAAGSPRLVSDLDAFGPALARALTEGDTMNVVLELWEAARLQTLR